MSRSGWRRFVPKVHTVSEHHTDLVMANVLSELVSRNNIHNIHQLDPLIDMQRHKVELAPTTENWFLLMILQTPRAARAQIEMDQHPHGYRDKQARLYELIDFNDSYVSTVLSLRPEALAGFDTLAHREMNTFCMNLRTTMFSDEQFDAITRGLSREVAVYRSAIKDGFKASMTSRTEDAFGIDMIISDKSGAHINVDCKTAAAYNRRLEELIREGRLGEADAEEADKTGYCQIYYSQDERRTLVTLLRIGPELGMIKDFEFTNPDLLNVRLRYIFDLRS